MTTISPPEPPQTQTPPPASGPRARGARAVSTIAIVFGSLIAIGTLTSAVFASVVSAGTQTVVREVSADALASLAVDVSAGSVRVEYGDVEAAVLEVTGGWDADRWTFDRDGGALVVSTPDRFFGFGWVFGGPSTATLTLPRELEDTALDADFSLSAGDLDATGTYGLLDIDVSAGSIDVSGTAADLTADLSAGRADLDVADVESAIFSVSAGQIVSHLTGSAPDDVTVQVSAGSLELTVPDETYDVNVDVSAGDLDNRLQTSATATRTITGEISAGDILLRAAD